MHVELNPFKIVANFISIRKTRALLESSRAALEASKVSRERAEKTLLESQKFMKEHGF